MPVVPSCLLEPAWVEFSALLDERRGGAELEFHPDHPLGCHRRRVPGRVVFEHVAAALVRGSGYERIATAGCSDRTIRRRLACWADLGVGQALHAAALRAYDQVIGLPPCRPPPKQLHGVLPGDRACHLDAGYDSAVTRHLLDELGFDGHIARKGVPAPLQAGGR